MSEQPVSRPHRQPVPLAMATSHSEYQPGQQEMPVVLTTPWIDARG
jgi:hypothetical protein